MATLKNTYSDIDFNFTMKPMVGDIALSYDNQAVIRSIRNLLLTNFYERPFNPDLGSNINNLLFENISVVTSMALQNEIERVINNYEPRAQLKTVVITPNPDTNSYAATITFFLQNQATPTTITVLLERVR